MNWELIILLLTPIVFSLIAYLAGKKNPAFAKMITLAVVTANTIYSIILWVIHFIPADQILDEPTGFLMHVKVPWIESVGISFSVGVDGLSMPLVVLTQVIFLRIKCLIFVKILSWVTVNAMSL